MALPIKISEALPDLRLRDITVGGTLSVGSNVSVGSTVSISATTYNDSTVKAGASTTKYWLSNDQKFDSSDIALGSQSINSLSAGASQSNTLKFTYDKSWGTGIKYIIAQADSGNVVTERYENNNIMALPIKTFNVSVAAVTSVIGGNAQNVGKYLPLIIDALKEFGIYTKNTVIATIATIGTEVASFTPINEYGGNAYFKKMYEGRKDLGNTQAGDGVKYHGRGFIQITGRANYQYYGKALGVDLVNNPDLALDPKIAARILALYFKNRGIATLAENSNWEGVRRGVNGGLNGWDRFIGLVNKAKQYIV
jgi:predicted chitinase